MSHHGSTPDHGEAGEASPLLLQPDSDENVCQCFNQEVINVHPRVVLAFLITTTVLITCGALLVARPTWHNALLPIMSTLCGLWIPSPAQAAGRGVRSRVTTA